MQVYLRLRGALSMIATLAALSVCASLGAKEADHASLVIELPHAMATAPGQPHGAVFFKSISNKAAQADQLIGGRAAVSKSVEVHRMEMENNIMKMREIVGVELPANSKVMLGRGNKEGYHLMLMNLKAPLKEGERFPMTLIFKRAGELEVTVTVEKPSMSMHGGHKH
jgi:periplasmic copper chaperone A